MAVLIQPPVHSVQYNIKYIYVILKRDKIQDLMIFKDLN